MVKSSEKTTSHRLFLDLRDALARNADVTEYSRGAGHAAHGNRPRSGGRLLMRLRQVNCDTHEDPSLVLPVAPGGVASCKYQEKYCFIKGCDVAAANLCNQSRENGRLIKRKCGTALQEMGDSCPHLFRCSARSGLFYVFYV